MIKGLGNFSRATGRASRWWAALSVIAAGFATPVNAQGIWPQLAGGPARWGVVSGELPDITQTRWVAATDQSGNTITFSPQAGLVANESFVYAIGKVSPPGQPANQYRVFAFRRSSGACVWSSAILTPTLDSLSTPALDRSNRTVIVASGSHLRAFDWTNGVLLWDRGLARNVVNASPVVTDDLGPADRVFITDYDGFGAGAKLYCVNVDPFVAGVNAYQPGEIVWSATIGASSGNSPAYLPREAGGLGLVYVATSGDFGFDPGRVLAFPATSVSPTAPSTVWEYVNETGEGFFGGLSVVPPATSQTDPAVLVASYAFSGGLSAGNMVRLNGRTGAADWSIAANRSASVPIALPNGRVLLSGGINGYGSVPGVQLFADGNATGGSGVSVVWDTILGTWVDTGNGAIDIGEFVLMGGWNQQPAVCVSTTGTRVYVGAIPTGADAFAFSSAMREINPNTSPTPSLTGFVTRQAAVGIGGGSPAIAGMSLYSVGASGLAALGALRSDFDVNGDGRVSIADLYAWEQAVGPRDIDRDGSVTASDRRRLIAAIREAERDELASSGGQKPLSRGEGGGP